MQTYVQDLITSADPRATLQRQQALQATTNADDAALSNGTTRAA